jgi:hypothetical protein
MMAVFATVNSLVQLITTNEMRGRVMSVYNFAFRGGMPMGNLLSGWLVPCERSPRYIFRWRSSPVPHPPVVHRIHRAQPDGRRALRRPSPQRRVRSLGRRAQERPLHVSSPANPGGLRMVRPPSQAQGVTVAVAALFALSLMAKPMSITLPLLLLSLDYWPLRRLAGEALVQLSAKLHVGTDAPVCPAEQSSAPVGDQETGRSSPTPNSPRGISSARKIPLASCSR